MKSEPDEIVISTLGPVGLLGILIIRLLHVKCMSIFRPDFTDKVTSAIEDETVESLIEDFTSFFYSLSDKILVSEGKDILELVKRGYSREKIAILTGSRMKPSFLPNQSPNGGWTGVAIRKLSVICRNIHRNKAKRNAMEEKKLWNVLLGNITFLCLLFFSFSLPAAALERYDYLEKGSDSLPIEWILEKEDGLKLTVVRPGETYISYNDPSC